MIRSILNKSITVSVLGSLKRKSVTIETMKNAYLEIRTVDPIKDEKRDYPLIDFLTHYRFFNPQGIFSPYGFFNQQNRSNNVAKND